MVRVVRAVLGTSASPATRWFWAITLGTCFRGVEFGNRTLWNPRETAKACVEIGPPRATCQDALKRTSGPAVLQNISPPSQRTQLTRSLLPPSLPPQHWSVEAAQHTASTALPQWELLVLKYHCGEKIAKLIIFELKLAIS